MNDDPLLQLFEYGHLPKKLQDISKPFCELAMALMVLPVNSQRTRAVEKLLEAKDCAVRALIYKG